jgi:hypothetical protein
MHVSKDLIRRESEIFCKIFWKKLNQKPVHKLLVCPKLASHNHPVQCVACAQVTGVPGARAACILHSRTTKTHPTTDHHTPSSLHLVPLLLPLASATCCSSPASAPLPRRLGFASAAAAGGRVSGAGRRGMSSSRRPAGSRVLTTPLTDGGW